jgi:hypothetical protein
VSDEVSSEARILAVGQQAITELVTRFNQPVVAPICHHFTPRNADEHEEWGSEGAYCARAKPLFEGLSHGQYRELSIDYIGGSSGIEAWEGGWPTIEWLHFRVRQMVEVAAQAGLIYQGWSFEPPEGPFVAGTIGLSVWNAATAEGQEKIQELIRDAERSRQAEDDS